MGYCKFDLTAPSSEFFRVQGDLPVAARFLVRFVTPEGARSNTDKGAMTDPGGPYGRRFNLDSVASKSLSVGLLKSSTGLAKGTFANPRRRQERQRAWTGSTIGTKRLKDRRRIRSFRPLCRNTSSVRETISSETELIKTCFQRIILSRRELREGTT